jgi:hypothetical protein
MDRMMKQTRETMSAMNDMMADMGDNMSLNVSNMEYNLATMQANMDRMSLGLASPASPFTNRNTSSPQPSAQTSAPTASNFDGDSCKVIF